MANCSLFETHAGILPAELFEHAVGLGEGNTPLVKLRRLPEKHGVDLELFVKVEGANPTGSFKDRGMVAAVANARMRGAGAVLCASTGNTSAAAAAYAAAAGIACVVLLPAGKVAAGKLAQATVHGARCLMLDGNFDEAMEAVRKIDAEAIEVVNSINPMRIQGQKTIAHEIVAQLGKFPDVHALPVGNAGNITAHWIGYCEQAGLETKACDWCDGKCPFKDGSKHGSASRPPRMLGVQATGAAPFLAGAPVENPETVATAIRIGNPQSWSQAKAAINESGGSFMAVSDKTLLGIQAELASTEGVFCEPASAAGLAGALEQAKTGAIDPGSTVVCTLTGNGLKDPDAVAEPQGLEKIDPAKLPGLLSKI